MDGTADGNLGALLLEFVAMERTEDLIGGRAEYIADRGAGGAKVDWKIEWLRFFIWFVGKRVNKRTGSTILEEFVGGVAPDRESAGAVHLLDEVIFDEFTVQEGGAVATVKAGTDGKTYSVRPGEHAGAVPEDGGSFIGMVRPLDDGTYSAFSLMDRKSLEPFRAILDELDAELDVFLDEIVTKGMRRLRRKIESVRITPQSELPRVLSRYPDSWVMRIHDTLYPGEPKGTGKAMAAAVSGLLTSDGLRPILDGLGEGAGDCLKLVAGSGGILPYEGLQKRVGPDDVWQEEPESPIGMLRVRGLLLVGLQRRGARTYKVAVVPPDVLACMRKIGYL